MARQATARPADTQQSIARSAVPGLALTVPSFLVGGLAGTAIGAGHATWLDVAYLLAPALIALIQAIAKRIAADRRAARRYRHGAS